MRRGLEPIGPVPGYKTAVPEFHLAQLNVARLVKPIDHPDMAEFAAALEPINALAEASEGFVWRLTAEDGQPSTYLDPFDDPQMAVNLTVWETIEHLRHYVYKSGHVVYLRRKLEWFDKPGEEAHVVAWWVPAGTLPTVSEALDRLAHLEANGPTERAFPLTKVFPPPS